jgi:hypothetical protein
VASKTAHDELLGQDASILGAEPAPDPFVGQDASSLDEPPQRKLYQGLPPPSPESEAALAQARKYLKPAKPPQYNTPDALETGATEFSQGFGKEWFDEAEAKGFKARDYLKSLMHGHSLKEAADQVEGTEKAVLPAIRERRRAGQKEHPGLAAASNLAGNLASDFVLDSATGGALRNSAGASLMGGITGAGSSDGDLLSWETAAKTGGGALLGKYLGKAATKYPVGTPTALSVLGLGAAAFGGHKGADGQPYLSDYDRWQMGLTGGLAGGAAALSKLLSPVAEWAGAGAQAARNELEGPLRNKDVAVAEGLAKNFDDQDAKFNKSLSDAGKDKIRAFKKLVISKVRGKKAEQAAKVDEINTDDAAVSKSFANSQNNQDTHDGLSVEALQTSERKPSPPKGATPDQVAEFEAAIPGRVQGKQDADYQAVLHRYLTMKELGHEIPPELQTRVNGLVERYSKNSPGFFNRFLYDHEANADKYRQELMTELAAMKNAASSARPGQDTGVGLPKNLTVDTQIAGVPKGQQPIATRHAPTRLWQRRGHACAWRRSSEP